MNANRQQNFAHLHQQATASQSSGDALPPLCTVPEGIVKVLNEARANLLGTSPNNPLINTTRGSLSAVEVADECSIQVFMHLVQSNRPMKFESMPSNDEISSGPAIPLPLPKSKGVPPHQKDDKLRTKYGPTELQERLFKLDRSARLSIEEKGARSLYLCLGGIEWSDVNSQKSYQSPLLLVPVELRRCSVTEHFLLHWTGEEVRSNPALELRLHQEVNLRLPLFTELEQEEGLDRYLKSIESVIKPHTGIKLNPDQIDLRLLNFENQVIFQDLDPSSAIPGNSSLLNPLVQRLLGASSHNYSYPVASTRNESESISSNLNIFSCDSSQDNVLHRISRGEDLFVVGPPGTGKTTTLVNAAVAAVLRRQSVLFITEKRAGAEVFLKWLDSIGLREIALDLHSSTSRSSVLNDLRSAVSIGEPRVETDPSVEAEHAALSNRLNSFRCMLGSEIRESGFSAYQILANVISLQSFSAPNIQLDLQRMQTWGRSDYTNAVKFVEQLQHHHLSYGVPSGNPYWGTQLSEVSSELGGRIQSECRETLALLGDITTEAHLLCSKMGLPTDVTVKTLADYATTLQHAAIIGRGMGETYTCFNFDHSPSFRDLDATIQHCQDEANLLELLSQIEGTIDEKELASIDYKQCLASITTFFSRNPLLRWINPGEFSAKRDTMRKFGRFEETQIGFTRRLQELQSLRDLLAESDSRNRRWSQLFIRQSPEYKPKDLFFWQIVKEWMPLLTGYVQNSADSAATGERRRIIELSLSSESSEHRAISLKTKITSLQSKLAHISEILILSDAKRTEILEKTPLSKLRTVVTAWRDSIPQLNVATSYNSILRRFDSKFHFIAEASDSYALKPRELINAFKQHWFGDLARLALALDQQAKNFDVESHQDLISRFCSLEIERMQQSAERIAAHQASSSPSAELGGESTTLLSALRLKGAGNTPIRRLFQDASHAMRALKPIVVASPHTAAMLLPRNQEPYDLVLIDEISQMSAAKSLVAVSRAKQLVGFGDPHQLVPTAFFGTGADVTLPIEGEDKKFRSLLDLLERARFPKATLDSHYRSLRPGAIELANSTFYDNRLKIFPSAEVGAAAKGLSFNFVSNGVYRSQVSTNVKEGSAVVEAIVSHIHSSPSLSLGVVTFNDQQRDLIDRLLEQKRSDDPVIDRFFSNHPHEELFIKNIENVQGDERDVIFVSIGYGHDSEGHFSMNFGPINQPDGPNRINTMMTRYKSQMTIFASFEPNDPAFDRTNARGIKILQKLLKIANGYIEQEIHEQRAVLDPFQLAIAEFLTNKGYTVHANIGPSGSGVNLAVVNPNDTGKYLLGILTDGEDYQSIAGASDRERIKIRALLDRGWNIHRAWCLDWFNNPETARKNLFGLLKSIASAEGAPVLIGGDSAPRRRPKVLRKQRQPLVASFTYKKAELNPDEFLVRYRESDRVRAASECGKIIDKIVRTEGPIHEQNILRRVCEVAGLSRNEKSKAIFSEAFKNWKEQRNAEEHNGFFTSGEITIVPRDRSQLHDEEREANDVDSRELQALINKVVRYSFGIKTEELCAIVNTSLGIRRTSFDELKIRTIDMLEKAIGLGEFREENGVIRVA